MRQYTIKVNGKSYVVEVEETSAKIVSNAAATTAPKTTVRANTPAPASTKGKDIVSPLPGVIIDLRVNVGDKVKAGQSVATLEAMKMENAIEAEVSGTVTAIHVQKGDSVLEGAKIITIA